MFDPEFERFARYFIPAFWVAVVGLTLALVVGVGYSFAS
jgi:hypothetical protein